jgi:hypothetical protein
MMASPTKTLVSPRKPATILPIHVGEILFLPSPTSASRNSLHVIALYKKTPPIPKKASATTQSTNKLLPASECVPGTAATIADPMKGREYGDSLTSVAQLQ